MWVRGILISAMIEDTDEQLASRAKLGDEVALELLISRYLKPVYGFVRQYVSDFDLAQDATQEIFVKLWKYIGRYNEKQLFRPWIYTISKRTALDYVKRKHLIPFSDLVSEDGTDWLSQTVQDTAPGPEDQAQSGFEQLRVNNALGSLSPKYAEVVTLYHHEGLKFAEIAKVLKEPLNTVKSRYRRALVKLKQALTS